MPQGAPAESRMGRDARSSRTQTTAGFWSALCAPFRRARKRQRANSTILSTRGSNKQGVKPSFPVPKDKEDATKAARLTRWVEQRMRDRWNDVRIAQAAFRRRARQREALGLYSIAYMLLRHVYLRQFRTRSQQKSFELQELRELLKGDGKTGPSESQMDRASREKSIRHAHHKTTSTFSNVSVAGTAQSLPKSRGKASEFSRRLGFSATSLPNGSAAAHPSEMSDPGDENTAFIASRPGHISIDSDDELLHQPTRARGQARERISGREVGRAAQHDEVATLENVKFESENDAKDPTSGGAGATDRLDIKELNAMHAIQEGFLSKKGSRSGLTRHRWFRLVDSRHGFVLVYYAKEFKRKRRHVRPVGAIRLRDATVSRHATKSKYFVISARGGLGPFDKKLPLRDHSLKAKTRSERDAWVETLQGCTRAFRPSASRVSGFWGRGSVLLGTLPRVAGRRSIVGTHVPLEPLTREAVLERRRQEEHKAYFFARALREAKREGIRAFEEMPEEFIQGEWDRERDQKLRTTALRLRQDIRTVITILAKAAPEKPKKSPRAQRKGFGGAASAVLGRLRLGFTGGAAESAGNDAKGVASSGLSMQRHADLVVSKAKYRLVFELRNLRPLSSKYREMEAVRMSAEREMAQAMRQNKESKVKYSVKNAVKNSVKNSVKRDAKYETNPNTISTDLKMNPVEQGNGSVNVEKHAPHSHVLHSQPFISRLCCGSTDANYNETNVPPHSAKRHSGIATHNPIHTTTTHALRINARKRPESRQVCLFLMVFLNNETIFDGRSLPTPTPVTRSGTSATVRVGPIDIPISAAATPGVLTLSVRQGFRDSLNAPEEAGSVVLPRLLTLVKIKRGTPLRLTSLSVCAERKRNLEDAQDDEEMTDAFEAMRLGSFDDDDSQWGEIIKKSAEFVGAKKRDVVSWLQRVDAGEDHSTSEGAPQSFTEFVARFVVTDPRYLREAYSKLGRAIKFNNSAWIRLAVAAAHTALHPAVLKRVLREDRRARSRRQADQFGIVAARGVESSENLLKNITQNHHVYLSLSLQEITLLKHARAFVGNGVMATGAPRPRLRVRGYCQAKDGIIQELGTSWASQPLDDADVPSQGDDDKVIRNRRRHWVDDGAAGFVWFVRLPAGILNISVQILRETAHECLEIETFQRESKAVLEKTSLYTWNLRCGSVTLKALAHDQFGMKGWVKAVFRAAMDAHIAFEDLMACECVYFCLSVQRRRGVLSDSKRDQIRTERMNKVHSWGLELWQCQYANNDGVGVNEGSSNGMKPYVSAHKVSGRFPLDVPGDDSQEDAQSRKNQTDHFEFPSWKHAFIPLSRLQRDLPLTLNLLQSVHEDTPSQDKRRSAARPSTVATFSFPSFNHLKILKPGTVLELQELQGEPVQDGSPWPRGRFRPYAPRMRPAPYCIHVDRFSIVKNARKFAEEMILEVADGAGSRDGDPNAHQSKIPKPRPLRRQVSTHRLAALSSGSLSPLDG